VDEATQFSTQPWVARLLSDLQSGRIDSIEASLPSDPVQRLECLKAYISTDIRSKLSAGESIDQAAYLQTWPELEHAWLEQAVGRPDVAAASEQSSRSDVAANVPAHSSSGSQRPGRWQQGETIGQFAIVSKIGEGAHGLVFLADDTLLNRLVAIKVSPDHGSEGRILARLHHPSIVEIYEQFVHAANRCLVMPYIKGPTLVDLLKQEPYLNARHWNSIKVRDWIVRFTQDRNREYLRCRPGSATELTSDFASADSPKTQSYSEVISSWVLRIAHALQHAHSRGVLHRDIKPSNVILDSADTPMLTDFNVAAIESTPEASETSSFGGTLSYMSPEHVRAFEAATGEEFVDTRSDLYSLGVVFIELLTGHKHWSSLDELSSLLESRSISCTLMPILHKCVQPLPAERYQGAHELIQDLEAWLAGRPLLQARPINWKGTLVAFVHRRSKSLAISVGLTATVLGLFGVGNMRTASLVERCRVLTDDAEEQVRRGNLVQAFDTIGEAKGLIASAPAVAFFRPTDSDQLRRRWDQLLLVGKAARLDGQLEALRQNQVAALLPSQQSQFESSSFAPECLAEYRLLSQADWENHPPFATLSLRERTRVSQQLTELVLLLGLQREHMTATQLEKWNVVRSRLPARYRNAHAFKLLEESAESDSTNNGGHHETDDFEEYLLGIVQMDRGEFSIAKSHFQSSRIQASRTSAPRYWCVYWEALTCQELGLVEEATMLYGACLGQDPGFSWPYINLSLLYAAAENFDLARRFIDQAIEADPSQGLSHETRAAICLKQQDYPQARESIAAAEKLGYNSDRLKTYRSICEQY
jgi:eukaryotic-like serine/threonine-protein kinase